MMLTTETPASSRSSNPVTANSHIQDWNVTTPGTAATDHSKASPPSLLFSGCLGEKRLWREDNHSQPSSAAINNAWNLCCVCQRGVNRDVVFFYTP
jgi:hypothetical protein